MDCPHPRCKHVLHPSDVVGESLVPCVLHGNPFDALSGQSAPYLRSMIRTLEAEVAAADDPLRGAALYRIAKQLVALDAQNTKLQAATATIDRVAHVLDGKEWSPDTLDAIADLIREVAGRPVREPQQTGYRKRRRA